QISGADGPRAGGQARRVVGRGVSFQRDLVAQSGAGSGQKVGDSGGFHAGQAHQLRKKALLHLSDTSAVLVPPGPDVKYERMTRLESHFHASEILKRPQQQAGGGEQEQGDRDLAGDQRTLRTAAPSGNSAG